MFKFCIVSMLVCAGACVCVYALISTGRILRFINILIINYYWSLTITSSRTHAHTYTHTHGRTHAQTHLGHAQTRNLKKFKKLVINQRNYNPLEKTPRFVSETFFFLFLLPSLLGFYLPLSFPCLIFIFSCLLSLQSYFSYARKPR